jgi:hypothetical protein
MHAESDRTEYKLNRKRTLKAKFIRERFDPDEDELININVPIKGLNKQCVKSL